MSTTNKRTVISSNDDATTSEVGRVLRSQRKKSKTAKTGAIPATTTLAATTTDGGNDGVEKKPWYDKFTNGDSEYNDYMANEWSYEKHGDAALFEKLSLEGAQSGLSWLTILRKREAYRREFHGFDPHRVAGMTTIDVERIVNSESDSKRDMVVRHKGKIEAVINNANCILEMYEKHPNKENVFDDFLWSFVDEKPILNAWKDMSSMPSKTPESEAMSKALKELGFRFVGPTTCYSLMQSVGMVIDHPKNSIEWDMAAKRLQTRPGGYQNRP